MQQELNAQKNLIRQQAADEKRHLEEQLNELKLDFQDEKSRADENDAKVCVLFFIVLVRQSKTRKTFGNSAYMLLA